VLEIFGPKTEAPLVPSKTGRREGGFERIFSNANASPMHNFISGSLSRVLDLNISYRTTCRIGYFCSGRLNNLPLIEENGIGDIPDVTQFSDNIGSQLTMTTADHYSYSPNQSSELEKSYGTRNDGDSVTNIPRVREEGEVMHILLRWKRLADNHKRRGTSEQEESKPCPHGGDTVNKNIRSGNYQISPFPWFLGIDLE
jgi:hypothetical protein